MQIEVKKDRKEIRNIIYKNLKLIKMAGNKKQVCQDLADAILVYFMDKENNKYPKIKMGGRTYS